MLAVTRTNRLFTASEASRSLGLSVSIRRRALPNSHEVEVTFTVTDVGHLSPVAVVGDFNGWDPSINVMQLLQGQLTLTLVLHAQRHYEFRYHDGRDRWFNDEEADDYSDTPSGAINGVLIT